jgi:adenine-specific DNA methylase
MNKQYSFFQVDTFEFPNTRYQGSKAKLVDWIWEIIRDLDFNTALDAFGGTGSVSYKLKTEGKAVTYNDNLKFNHIIGKALIENSAVTLDDDDIDWILADNILDYPTFVHDTFADIYFTDEENRWIDKVITNISEIRDEYKKSLAFFALAQTCIVKRPYNLFHRKNLYMRLAKVQRSFGNKTSWDKSPDLWMKSFLAEGNKAVFDNQCENKSLNYPAEKVPGEFDLVYIDTPYISNKGTATNYLDFYHFLEGLADYDNWEDLIDFNSKNRKFINGKSEWDDKNKIHKAFDKLFERFQDSLLVVSYRSDGIPSISELGDILRRYKSKISVYPFGEYKYVLSKNANSNEVLVVAK